MHLSLVNILYLFYPMQRESDEMIIDILTFFLLSFYLFLSFKKKKSSYTYYILLTIISHVLWFLSIIKIGKYFLRDSYLWM